MYLKAIISGYSRSDLLSEIYLVTHLMIQKSFRGEKEQIDTCPLSIMQKLPAEADHSKRPSLLRTRVV
jgi:hypothetical protein